MSTVTIFQLHSASARCQGQQLMPEADTKDGDLRGLHKLAQVVDRFLTMRRVAGSV